MLRNIYGFCAAILFCLGPLPTCAAPIGTATASFDNLKPDKSETEWGRFVADAVRDVGHADIALVNAGAFKRGQLKAGPIEQTNVDALLAFGDDDIVVISLTGEQLRAGLERAIESYPDGSPAFLQGSGFTAAFNSQAPIDKRVTMVRVQDREVQNRDIFHAAMPVSLAEGAAGYFTIWNGKSAKPSGDTLRAAVVASIRAQHNIAPSPQVRFAPQ